MANMVLFWDGADADIPSGWSKVSDSGEDFYQRTVRGASSYGVVGSGHSHSLNLQSSSYTFDGARFDDIDPNAVAGDSTHGHSLNTISITSEEAFPSYKTIKVIQATGIPSTLPANTIAMFKSGPSRWTRLSGYDGYFLRGDASAGSTGGSSSHDHGVSGTSGIGPNVDIWDDSGTLVTADHTHSINKNTSSTSYNPPYLDVLIYRKDSDGYLTAGMIALFDGDPGSGWTTVSAASGQLLRGSSAYGGTGGGGSHSHPSVSTAKAGTTGNKNRSGYDTSVPHPDHTHNISIGSVSDALPPHVNAIIAQRDFSAPSIDSIVWSGTDAELSWSSDEVESFEVRRSTNGGSWQSIANLSGDVFSYTDTGVSKDNLDNKHEYEVIATDVEGNTKSSNIPTIYSQPSVDTMDGATYNADDDIDVSVTTNASYFGTRDFEVSVNDGSWGVFLNGSKNTTVTDTGGTTDEKREYRTKVFAPDGTASDYSSVSTPVYTSLNTPSAPSLTVQSDGQVDLSFSSANPNTSQGVDIEIRPVGGNTFAQIASLAQSATSYSDTGKEAFGNVEYRIAESNPDHTEASPTSSAFRPATEVRSRHLHGRGGPDRGGRGGAQPGTSSRARVAYGRSRGNIRGRTKP